MDRFSEMTADERIDECLSIFQEEMAWSCLVKGAWIRGLLIPWYHLLNWRKYHQNSIPGFQNHRSDLLVLDHGYYKRDVGVVACGLRRTLDFENYDLYWNEKLLIQCWRIETETSTEDHVPNCMMLFLIIHSWPFTTICKALLAKFINPSKINPEEKRSFGKDVMTLRREDSEKRVRRMNDYKPKNNLLHGHAFWVI